MSEANKFLSQLARQLYAMSRKSKDKDLAATLPNERYQRTFTDEYPFAKKSRGRFSPVDKEQKQAWRRLAEK